MTQDNLTAFVQVDNDVSIMESKKIIDEEKKSTLKKSPSVDKKRKMSKSTKTTKTTKSTNSTNTLSTCTSACSHKSEKACSKRMTLRKFLPLVAKERKWELSKVQASISTLTFCSIVFFFSFFFLFVIYTCR
jgi:hypothetical protein